MRIMIASGRTALLQAACTARHRWVHTYDCYLPSQQSAWRGALPPAPAALSHGPLFQVAIAVRHEAHDFATRQKHVARRAFFRAWVNDCAWRQTIAHDARVPGSCLETADRRRGKVIRWHRIILSSRRYQIAFCASMRFLIERVSAVQPCTERSSKAPSRNKSALPNAALAGVNPPSMIGNAIHFSTRSGLPPTPNRRNWLADKICLSAWAGGRMAQGADDT